MKSSKTEHGKVALDFANALVKGNFDYAYTLLGNEVRVSLEDEYREMTEYGEGPVTYIEVMNEMTEWPTKRENDIGWAYVALQGEMFSEAVAVVISRINNSLKITEIEWGRP